MNRENARHPKYFYLMSKDPERENREERDFSLMPKRKFKE